MGCEESLFSNSSRQENKESVEKNNATGRIRDFSIAHKVLYHFYLKITHKILKIVFQGRGEKHRDSLAIASIFNDEIGKL